MPQMLWRWGIWRPIISGSRIVSSNNLNDFVEVGRSGGDVYPARPALRVQPLRQFGDLPL